MSDRLSDLIVQATLVLLVLFSVATWAVVLVKGLQSRRSRRKDAQFASTVGPARELPELEALRAQDGPAARVALAGALAWENAGSQAAEHLQVSREILELALRRQIQKERRATESGLAVLASIGTTSPFVGLFGTVWGILHALKSISASGSASLDVVAGPIGEALIATGVGIAVAVPAVLAFNFFVRRLKVQSSELEDYANAFVSAALRSTLSSARPKSISGEHPVSKLTDLRGPNLREARG